MDLHVFKSPESENHIFSGWCVRKCICVSSISIIEKQIRAETYYLVFYIYVNVDATSNFS